MELKRVELRGGGMFSNVNEIVQRLHIARQKDFGFVIQWPDSFYKSPNRPEDPWSYFFDQCFPCDGVTPDALPRWEDAGTITIDRNGIITPRAGWRQGRMLLFPADRHLAAGYIAAHLTLKPPIAKIIADFAATHFQGPIIGLHIRGQGRDHGGAAELRAKLPCEDGVPYAHYFNLVRQELDRNKDSRIFLCTDSKKVIRRVRQEFGDRVFWYESARSDFGEMHERHKSAENEQFDGYKLGEDILVEAYLLAQTDVFIHGHSNVANFVLCKSPDLPNRYAYDGIEAFTFSAALTKELALLAFRVRRRLGLAS